MPYRLIRKIRQLRIRHSQNPRPDSFPFISGDGFRSLAQYIYEKGVSSFDPKSVQAKDIVFVEGDLLVDFFEHVHPRIANPYILMSHNADIGIDVSYAKRVDAKIIHWFAMNVLIVHEKITPIPIGIENAYYANAGWKGFFAQKPVSADDMRPRAFMQFSIATNPSVRGDVFDTLKGSSVVDTPPFKNQRDSVRGARRYRFIVSPPGNGEDCHRTWEAMLWNSVPIVRHSVAIDSFIRLGLPLWAIDSWNEVAIMSEYDLKEKYDVIRSSCRTEALYMDYLKSLIYSYRQ